MVSVGRSPWFDWHRDALSDLGVGSAALWFNLGLLGGGLLNVVATIGIWVWIGRGTLEGIGSALLLIGSGSIASVGVCTVDYGALHNNLAAAYFLMTPLGCLLLAAALIRKNRRLHGALTGSAGVAALSAALLTPHRGVAVPEMLAALILSGWIYSTGLALLAQPGG
jgi:hypothetical membrane protein